MSHWYSLPFRFALLDSPLLLPPIGLQRNWPLDTKKKVIEWGVWTKKMEAAIFRKWTELNGSCTAQKSPNVCVCGYIKNKFIIYMIKFLIPFNWIRYEIGTQPILGNNAHFIVMIPPRYRSKYLKYGFCHHTIVHFDCVSSLFTS